MFIDSSNSTRSSADSAEPDITLQDSQKTARLQELAQNIQTRSKRLVSDIYWLGKDLLEAKELFGRGQNEAFLHWARQHTKIQTTLIYRFMQVAEAFPELQEQDFEVVATALYAIASPNTPIAARTEFITRSRSGEVISLPESQAIIQRYKGSEDVRFERYQKLVKAWGTLERSEVGEAKLSLQTVEDQTYEFRNYTELKQAYTTWRKDVFAADLEAVRVLTSPYWSIRTFAVPNQPFRLEAVCEIPGCHKTLVASNPRSLIEWWYSQGQILSERLSQNRTDLTSPKVLSDLSPTSLPKPTCLSCSWHEPKHQGAGEDEFWCGFYRSAFNLEQAPERPHICRKWKPISAVDSADYDDARFTQSNSISNTKNLGRVVPSHTPQLPSSLVMQKSNVLHSLLQQVETLTDEELDRLEEAVHIARLRRGAVSGSIPNVQVSVGSPKVKAI